MCRDVDKIKLLGALVPNRAFAQFGLGGKGQFRLQLDYRHQSSIVLAISSIAPQAFLMARAVSINPLGGNRPARGGAVLRPGTGVEPSLAQAAQLEGEQVVAGRDP